VRSPRDHLRYGARAFHVGWSADGTYGRLGAYPLPRL